MPVWAAGSTPSRSTLTCQSLFRWLLLLFLLLIPSPTISYVGGGRVHLQQRRRMTTIFLAANDSNDGGGETFWRKALTLGKETVNNLTQKDEYEFGDLSRWVEARLKDRVN